MNSQAVHSSRNGRIVLLQQVFIRGSRVRFVVVPGVLGFFYLLSHTAVIETSKVIAFYLREIVDQLRDVHRHAPMFRLPGKVGRGIVLARGRAVVARAERRLSARKRLNMMEFSI